MKNPYILASRSSFPTARLLKNFLNENYNLNLTLTSHLKSYNPSIRYGNSEKLLDNDISINTVDFINLLSNKLRFSNFLLENGLYAPVFKKDIPEVYPVIIRKYLSSCKGRGIIVCKNKEEFIKNNANNYWTEFIKTEFELRVHVVGGNIIKVFKKMTLDEEESFPIRTNENYHFGLKKQELYKKLVPIVEKLNVLLGTKCFYGLDIGWNNNKSSYFIFEANSAPGCNPETIEHYGNFLCKEVLSEER